MQIRCLYEDDSLVVCIKPAGVSSEGDGMPALLKETCGCPEIYCVHRLDLAAAGLMVYAKTREAAAGLSRDIAAGKFFKQYLAVVHGRSQDKARLWDLLFRDASKNKSYVVQRKRRGVREVALEYETVGRTETLSLVRIWLQTGRTHQIRVQFASRGMPLCGDRKYGSTSRDVPLALWSEALGFTHPVTRVSMGYSAYPPACSPWTEFDLPKEDPPEDS